MMSILRCFYVRPERTALLIIFLFIFVFSFAVAPSAQAGSESGACWLGLSSSCNGFSKLGNELGDALGGITVGIWQQLLELIGAATWWFTRGIAGLFTFILYEFNQNIGFVDNVMVQVGWSLTRDITNWFFIIFLLVSAVATILNLQKYNARAILPKLIIFAILVNFSLWITGFAVNIAQAVASLFVSVMAGPYPDIGQAFLNAAGVQNLKTPDFTVLAFVGDTIGDQLNTMASTIISITMLSILAFSLLILTLALIFRNIMVWILMILSPLAFLSAILPATQGFWAKWSKKFVEYTIFLPIAIFFVWLGTWLIVLLDKYGQLYPEEYEANRGFVVAIMAQMDRFMQFITISVFLFMAVIVTRWFAKEASAFVEKLAKTAAIGVGVAGGAAAIGLAGKGIAAGAGRAGVADKAASLANRVGLGRVGERLAGAQQRANARRTKKQEGRNLGDLSDDQFEKLAKTDAKKPIQSFGDKDIISDRSAFVVREAVKRGKDLGDLGYGDRRLAASTKKLHELGQSDELEAARPDLAANAGITKAQKKAKNAGAPISNEDATRQTVNEMGSQAFAKVHWGAVSKAAGIAGGEAAQAMLDELNAGIDSGKVDAPKLGALIRRAQDDSAADKSLRDIIVPRVQAADANNTLAPQTKTAIINDPAKNGYFNLS